MSLAWLPIKTRAMEMQSNYLHLRISVWDMSISHSITIIIITRPLPALLKKPVTPPKSRKWLNTPTCEPIKPISPNGHKKIAKPFVQLFKRISLQLGLLRKRILAIPKYLEKGWYKILQMPYLLQMRFKETQRWKELNKRSRKSWRNGTLMLKKFVRVWKCEAER